MWPRPLGMKVILPGKEPQRAKMLPKGKGNMAWEVELLPSHTHLVCSQHIAVPKGGAVKDSGLLGRLCSHIFPFLSQKPLLLHLFI